MSLSDVGQTFGSQSQSRRNVIAGWPKDPRGSWMPGGSKKKNKNLSFKKRNSGSYLCLS